MGFLTTSDPNLPTTPQAPGVSEGVPVEPQVNLPSSSPGDALWSFLNEDFTPTALAHHGAEYFNLYTQRNSFTGEGEFPGYDPLNDAQIAPYLDHANAFIRSRSPSETRSIIGMIERERANQDTMANAGVAGHALMFGAGLLDPITLLPFGVASRFIGGGKILQSALASAAAGGSGMFLTDELLQQTDPAATQRSVFADVASGTLLGGVLGSGIGAFSRDPAGARALADGLKAEMIAADQGGNPARVPLTDLGDIEGMPQSVGAAAARRATMEENTPTFSFGTVDLGANETPVGNPLSRMATSPSLESRSVARQLAEMPFRFEGERMGVAAPVAVETRMKQWQGLLADAFRDIDSQFLKYRGVATRLQAGLTDLAQLGRGAKLTFDDFKREIAFALRRNDEHAVSEVAAAAKSIRAKLLDPTKKMAIDVGLLDPDVKVDTSDSYLHRLYNVERIKAGRRRPDGSGFSQIVGRWLGTKRDEARAIPAEDIAKWDTLAGNAKENRERLEPIVNPHLKEKFVPAEGGNEAKTLPAQKLEPDMLRISKRATREAHAAQREAYDASRGAKSAQRRIGYLTTLLRRAVQRETKAGQPDKLAPSDPLVQAIDDVRAGTNRVLWDGEHKPQRLVDWLQKLGGLKDETGEVRGLGAKEVAPDLLKKDGLSLAEATDKAKAEGYLGPQATSADLVDALEGDLYGQPVYRPGDAQLVERVERAKELERSLKKHGIGADQPDEVIAHKLMEAEAGEELPAKQSARRKEAEKQAGYHADRLRAQLDKERAEFRAKTEKADAARTKAQGRSKIAGDLRAKFSELAREYAASKRLEQRYTKRAENTRAMAETPDEDFEKIADIIANKIEGVDGEGVYKAIEFAGLRGPLKERVFDIPDKLIEDFLDNDVERVLRRYTRTMSADTEMTRIFGDTDLREQAQAIIKDYDAKMAKTTDEGVQRKLSRRRESDLRDLYAMRDRMRGTYGMPMNPQGWAARTGTLIRNFNLLRQGGGFTLASVADVGSIAMTHGMGRMFTKGLAPRIAAMKQVKLNARELRLANVANDMILDTRAHAWADIADDYGRHSKVERAIGFAADKFGLVNLLSVWTGWWKSFSGGISMLRNMEAIEALAGGKASEKEASRLHWLGIDAGMAYRIDELAKKYGTREDGVVWPNTEAWSREGSSGEEAAAVLRGALAKDVDTTIVTPGQEKPLWMSTPLGKIVGQFRSFTLAAMARTTARGLQQRDSEALQGLILMTMGGMLSYYLKTKPEDLSNDPAVWVKEGVDRSGVTGWLFDLNNLVEKASGNRIGISPLLGQRPASRYATRGLIGSALGPTAGLADDLTQVLGAASQGQMTDKDWKRLQSLTPYGNLFYLRWLMDHAAPEGDAGS